MRRWGSCGIFTPRLTFVRRAFHPQRWQDPEISRRSDPAVSRFVFMVLKSLVTLSIYRVIAWAKRGVKSALRPRAVAQELAEVKVHSSA